MDDLNSKKKYGIKLLKFNEILAKFWSFIKSIASRFVSTFSKDNEREQKKGLK